jgi:hypothetical protein
MIETKEEDKDLEYWKNNCEEDYLHTPISVLRYIGELEKALEQVTLGLPSVSKECEHPYMYIYSKCGYEKCTKCDKVLCEG